MKITESITDICCNQNFLWRIISEPDQKWLLKVPSICLMYTIYVSSYIHASSELISSVVFIPPAICLKHEMFSKAGRLFMKVGDFRHIGECGDVSVGMAVTSSASWEPPVENNDRIHNGAYKGHLWEKPYPTACWEWGAIAADVRRTIRQQMPPKRVFSMSQAHISKSSIKEKPNVEEE